MIKTMETTTLKNAPSTQRRRARCPGALKRFGSVASITLAMCMSVSSARAATKPLTMSCVEEAAAAFGHPRMALVLILAQERGKVGECSAPNRNGTVDCGPAQINTNEIKRLAPILGVSADKALTMIRDDGCFNVFVSAFILSEKLVHAKGDLWDAMGRYNSATPGIKETYQNGLLKQYRALVASGYRPGTGAVVAPKQLNGQATPSDRVLADAGGLHQARRSEAEEARTSGPITASEPPADGSVGRMIPLFDHPRPTVVAQRDGQ